ncbi:hypothetical protein RhiirA4_400201, partial [Rhizophagus irregularis]
VATMLGFWSTGRINLINVSFSGQRIQNNNNTSVKSEPFIPHFPVQINTNMAISHIYFQFLLLYGYQ